MCTLIKRLKERAFFKEELVFAKKDYPCCKAFCKACAFVACSFRQVCTFTRKRCCFTQKAYLLFWQARAYYLFSEHFLQVLRARFIFSASIFFKRFQSAISSISLQSVISFWLLTMSSQTLATCYTWVDVGASSILFCICICFSTKSKPSSHATRG